MYARIVRASISPDRVDEAIDLWIKSVAPSVRQQKGFKSGRLLVERKTGKVVSLGLWEAEADLEGSVAWNQQQIAKFGGFVGEPPSVEHYEVAAEA